VAWKCDREPLPSVLAGFEVEAHFPVTINSSGALAFGNACDSRVKALGRRVPLASAILAFLFDVEGSALGFDGILLADAALGSGFGTEDFESAFQLVHAAVELDFAEVAVGIVGKRLGNAYA
jgi:hypothetical protein